MRKYQTLLSLGLTTLLWYVDSLCQMKWVELGSVWPKVSVKL